MTLFKVTTWTTIYSNRIDEEESPKLGPIAQAVFLLLIHSRNDRHPYAISRLARLLPQSGGHIPVEGSDGNGRSEATLTSFFNPRNSFPSGRFENENENDLCGGYERSGIDLFGARFETVKCWSGGK